MSGIRDIGGVTDFGAISVRDTANALVGIGAMLVRDAGGLFEVFTDGVGAFEVDVPPEVYGAGARNAAITVTTEQAVAAIAGGKEPYTYLWERSDGPLGTWSIVSPAASASSFRCSGVGPADSFTAQFTLKVTDLRGSVVVSSPVVATAENYGSLGGEPIP